MLERVNKGYVEVFNERWIPKQCYIWEHNFGKIEKDEVVVFLDRNNKNFNLSNLCKIKRKELVVINRWYRDCDLKTAIMIVRVKQKRIEVARKNGLTDNRGNIKADVKESANKWLDSHREERNKYIRELMKKKRMDPVFRENENKKQRERRRCK